MSKDTFYFSHDYNSRNDSKVRRLVAKHGMAGYGVFWSIVEDLYNNANALQTDYDVIAYDLRVDESMVKSIVEDFNLFVIDGDTFGSSSVERRLNDRNEKSIKAKRSANLRWEKKRFEDANALRAQSDGNAIKEKKGKEIKGNEKKENEIKSILMSEIEISDVPEDEKDYFLIADSFLKLFERNSQEVLKVKWSHLEKTKYKSFVDPIRLMMTVDGRTREEIQKVYKFLQSDDFWMRNIQSTEKLRKQFDQLITKTVEPIKTNNHGTEQRIKSGGVTFSQSEADDLQRRARKLLGLDANDDTTNF